MFAVFVWGSTWERTSRTNLFRPVREGGLGLTHLFLRQLVNRFLFLRDVTDPFLRTVCQLRLGSVLSEYVVTTEYLSGGVKGYFKEVVLSFRFLTARFSLDYLSTVTRKRLYKDIVDIVLPIPLYRSMYTLGIERNVLKRVKNMLVPSGVKNFFFKMHTGTLEVKTWMEQKQLFVPWGPDCFVCKKPETIEHVFLDCWGAVFFWDILQRTIKKEFPLDPKGIRFLSVKIEDGIPYDTVMLLGLHSIWRNGLAVRYSDVDVRRIPESFKESVHLFVEMYKVREVGPEWIPVFEELLKLKEY